MKIYAIDPKANTKIKQTLVTANMPAKREKNGITINTHSKNSKKAEKQKKVLKKRTVKQIKNKQHDARFKPNHVNYHVKLFSLNTVIKGRDCKTGYRKKDLTISCLQENYFKY